jgi:biotin carboxyl carrier protein
MLKINVEKGPEFVIEQGPNGQGRKVDGQPFNWDLVKTGPNDYHVIHDSKSYSAEVIKIDHEHKLFTVKVNNKLYNLHVRDSHDLLLEQLGMSKKTKSKANDLKAPMPGKILSVGVKEGDTVKKGDVVLILEAMKMENVLKSPADATIKAVKVVPGENVEKNHVLVIFG